MPSIRGYRSKVENRHFAHLCPACVEVFCAYSSGNKLIWPPVTLRSPRRRCAGCSLCAQLPSLSRWPWICCPGERICEWFVVSIHCELTAPLTYVGNDGYPTRRLAAPYQKRSTWPTWRPASLRRTQAATMGPQDMAAVATLPRCARLRHPLTERSLLQE